MGESWKTRADMGFDSKVILGAIEENTEATKKAEKTLVKTLNGVGTLLVVLTAALVTTATLCCLALS